MKLALPLLVLLGFVVGMAAGRWTAPVASGPPATTNIDTFRSALREQDRLTRTHDLSRFLLAFGPEDATETVAALEANRIGVLEHEMQLIMFGWTRFDAPAAFAWAKTDTYGKQGMAEKAAMFAWGFRDPLAAIEHLKADDEFDPESPLARAIVSGWSRNGDVPGVTDFIIAMPTSKHRSMLANNLTAIIANESTEDAISWAEAIPLDAPGEFKRVAYLRTMSALAQRDGPRAMRWYEEHRARDYTESSLDVLARRFVEYHDPDLLFAWLVALPPIAGQLVDTERDSAIRAGFRLWMKKKPSQASEWLELQAAILPGLDPAVAEMALARSRSAKKFDPAEALGWAIRIQDPKLRRDTIVPIARRWRRRDLDALNAWLSTADLSEEIREAILSEKPREQKVGSAKPARASKRRRP